MNPTVKEDLSFFLEGTNGKVILLLHGLTGAPSELKSIAKLLNNKGYSVYAPLIIGHGTTVEDLIKTKWQDWYDGIVEDLKFLQTKYSIIYTAGICFGGTLALMLTKDFPNIIKATVIYSLTMKLDGWANPYYYRGADWGLKIVPFIRKIMFKERNPYGIKNTKIRKAIVNALKTNEILDCFPGVSYYQYSRMNRIIKKDFANMKTPMLLIHSIEDDISSYKSALLLQKKYGGICDVHLINNSYHLIHLDQQRKSVANLTDLFFTEHNDH